MTSGIDYDPDSATDHLGTGSNGTYVFRGKYTWPVTGRVEDVAVKQILKLPGTDSVRNIIREVEALQSLDHTNVIKYINAEERGPFVIIVLQLCSGSLVNLIDDKKNVFGDKFHKKYKITRRSTKKRLLMGVASGMEYIHRKKIVHRDLKPHNILITEDESDISLLKAVISDFGLCKELVDMNSRLNPSRSLIGSQGWMPWEILMKKNVSPATAVDVFAFGCIVQFVMSFKRTLDQVHPFGSDDARHTNILDRNRVTYLYDNLTENYFCQENHSSYGDTILADILIDACIQSDPKTRMNAAEIVSHPFFWSYIERKQYVCRHFNNLKDYANQSESPQKAQINRLDALRNNLCQGEEYHLQIPEVWAYLERYSVQEQRRSSAPEAWRTSIFNGLMRAMRNISEHWVAAVLVHPPLEDLFGIPDLDGECDHEKMGIYFLEKIPKSFPIVYVSLMTQDIPDNSPMSERIKKFSDLGKKTLEKILT